MLNLGAFVLDMFGLLLKGVTGRHHTVVGYTDLLPRRQWLGRGGGGGVDVE